MDGFMSYDENKNDLSARVFVSLAENFVNDMADKERFYGNNDKAEEILDNGIEIFDFLDGGLIDCDLEGCRVTLTEDYDKLKKDYDQYVPWAREHARSSYDYEELIGDDGLKEPDNIDFSCGYLDGIVKNKANNELHFCFSEVDPMVCPEQYLLDAFEMCQKFVDYCTPDVIRERILQIARELIEKHLHCDEHRVSVGSISLESIDDDNVTVKATIREREATRDAMGMDIGAWDDYDESRETLFKIDLYKCNMVKEEPLTAVENLVPPPRTISKEDMKTDGKDIKKQNMNRTE